MLGREGGKERRMQRGRLRGTGVQFFQGFILVLALLPSSPCVHRSMYTCLLTEVRRLSLTPGAGATPGRELSDVGLGTKPQPSAKTASAFNC